MNNFMFILFLRDIPKNVITYIELYIYHMVVECAMFTREMMMRTSSVDLSKQGMYLL